MVEGVIVLPFFVIVLAAIIFFHRAYATKIEMGVKARSCAWNYAVNGCQKKFLPDDCPVSKIGGKAESVADLFGGSFPDEESMRKAKERRDSLSSQTSALDGMLGSANTLGLTILGLNEGIRVAPESSVAKPSILGGGEHSISANYSMMCNERNREFLEIAKSAYCDVSSALPGCPMNND